MTDVKHPGLTALALADGEAVEGIRKSVTIGAREKAIDVDARRVSVVLSTAEVDRDGDVIRQEGWRLDRYRQNPVVLAFHDPRQPVARGESIRIEGGNLVGDMQFPPAGKNRLSDEVFALYEAGVLSAVSVGFMPTRMQPRTDESGKMAGYLIEEAELFEFSAVSIPSNPGALVRAKAAGMKLGEVARALDAYLAEHADADARRAYVEIVGELHPSQRAELAARNFREKDADKGADEVAKAAPDALKVNDFVRWDSSGGTAQGQITRVERDGTINVPDSDFSVEGTEEDPAALIRIYRPDGDGWQATDRLVGHRFSTLTKIDPLPKPDAKAAPGTTFTTTGGEGHEHQFTVDANETEPAGDQEHIHAITRDDDGVVTIEPNEGHTHEAPSGAVLDAPEEDGKTPGEEGEGGEKMEPCADCKNADVCRAAGACYGGGKAANVPQPTGRLVFRDLRGEGINLVAAEVDGVPVDYADPELFARGPAQDQAEAAALRKDWPALVWLADMHPVTPEARAKWRDLVVAEKGKIIAEREKSLGIEIVAVPKPVEPAGLPADEARALADMIGKAVNEQLRRLTGRA